MGAIPAALISRRSTVCARYLAPVFILENIFLTRMRMHFSCFASRLPCQSQFTLLNLAIAVDGINKIQIGLSQSLHTDFTIKQYL